MKRHAYILLLAVLMLVCILSLASCIEVIVIPGVTDVPQNTPSDKNTNCLVQYYYGNDMVHSQTVKSGNPLNTFQLEEKDGLGSNGFLFTDFFADSACKTPFDFDAPITKNTKIYCRIYHPVVFYNGDVKVATYEVDALSGYFSQEQADEISALSKVYNGLFTDKNRTKEFDPTAKITRPTDVYCQILYIVDYVYVDKMGTETKIEGMRQRVDSVNGFTDEQKTAVYEYEYNGFRFDYFYTDSHMLRAFDFDEPLKKNTVIYCERDDTKAGVNVKWELSSDNKTLTFTGNGLMYEYKYNTDVPWYEFNSKIENVVIAEGITSIAGCAFYESSNIKQIELPDTIERIDSNAFYSSGIEEINFPLALKSIGKSAFAYCEGLVHLDFNEGLEQIEGSAFRECKNLTTVVLTPTIMGFGTSAFENCTNIASAYYIGTEEQFNSIDIMISNFWIDQLAHKYFISETEPAAPGPYWYYNDDNEICQWYYTIWYFASENEKLPFTVDYVDVDDGVSQLNIDNMLAGKAGNGTTQLYKGPNGYKFVGWKLKGTKNAYTLTLGTKFTEDIKLVGDRSNLCGDNLTWKYVAATTTLQINKLNAANEDGRMWDFENSNDAPWWESYRRRITNVSIANGVTHVGKHTFSEMFDYNGTTYKNFSYIVIPKSVTSIDKAAFYRCNRLLYIYYEGTPTDMYGNATTDPVIDGLTELNCLNADGMNTVVYANATGLDFSTLGEGAYWANIHTGAAVNDDYRVAWIYDADTKTLTVGGGDDAHIMINYTSKSQRPWDSYADEVVNVVINDNIQVIGHHSFEDMANVISITASSFLVKTSATAIAGTGYYNTEYAKGAVYIYTAGTEELRYAHLIKVNPDKAKEIFIIPERTSSIAEQAFEGCSMIKKLVFTKDIKTDAIYSTAFVGLTALEEVYYDGNIARWAEYANRPSGAGVKVLHYFTTKPLPMDLETYGLTLEDCWHWKDNREYTELVIWADEEA